MAGSMRVAKNTLFLYVRMVFVLLVQLYVSRVLLQQLGVVDYGLYNVIGGIVLMLGFVNSTAAGATSRFLTFSLAARDKDLYDYRTIFSLAFFIHLAIAVVLVTVAETAGVWYFDYYLVIPPERVEAGWWVLQLSIFTCLISFTQVPYNSSLIAHEHMNVYALVGVFEAVAKLAIAYALALSSGDKLVVYALLMFGLTVGVSVFYRVYCIRSFGDKCRLMICRHDKMLKMLLSYSVWDFIGCMGVMVRSQGVNLMLNAFFGPAINAARAITGQVEMGLMQLSNGFQTAVRPVIIKAYAEGNIEKMIELVRFTSQISACLFSLLGVPIFIEVDNVLDIWLNNPPEYTNVFVRMIIISCFASVVSNSLAMGVHAIGDVKRLNLYGGTRVFYETPIMIIFLYCGMPAYTVFAVMAVVSVLLVMIDLLVLKINVPSINYGHYYYEVFVKSFFILIIPTTVAYYVHSIYGNVMPIIAVILVTVTYWSVLLVLLWFVVPYEIKCMLKNKINAFIIDGRKKI